MDKRRSYAEVVSGSGKSFLYNYLRILRYLPTSIWLAVALSSYTMCHNFFLSESSAESSVMEGE